MASVAGATTGSELDAPPFSSQICVEGKCGRGSESRTREGVREDCEGKDGGGGGGVSPCRC